MKINRLETHDRLEHLKEKQSINISQGAEDCFKRNELSLALQEKSPYIYIYAHPRTIGMDEKLSLWASGQYSSFQQIPEKVMFWQARLTKPRATTNSYLFRGTSKSDIIEVCWLLPPEEFEGQYKQGNVVQHSIVEWSYMMFREHKTELEKSHPEDLPDHISRGIYRQVIKEHREEINRKKMMKTMPMISEASLPFFQ